MEKYGYRFSFGPWNIHEGADPFGPPVRPARDFEWKLAIFKELDFDAVQFHDDDAVPGLDDLSPAQIRQRARDMRQKLSENGLAAEFVAPRLWEHPMTIDGAFTSNDAKARDYALDRAKKAVDIAHELEAHLLVLWLAREGTYMREAKDVGRATHQLLDALNTLLDYDQHMRIAIEPKPNEPMDMSYIPTIGHGIALGAQTRDPSRMGVLMESAHAILAGLDPSDEIGFALSFGKLLSVHLNDQSGLKYDQDRSFGSVDLRRAFNQVRVLDNNAYWRSGVVGLDVKATISISFAILDESVLSFLGLGVQPPTPEWGAMINDAQIYLNSDPWMLVGPALAIILVVLSLNLLGDAIRDRLDPRDRVQAMAMAQE